MPKTAAGFEHDYNSLKKDLSAFYLYLRNIPPSTFSQLFKSVEIPAEIFSAMLGVLSEKGVDEDVQWVANVLVELGRAS